MGDTEHRIQHAESVSITPVVFGIRKSLAEQLGFVGREVSVNDLLKAIQSGKLGFCMASARPSSAKEKMGGTPFAWRTALLF